VLIAGDGRGFAVRGNDGRLAIHHIGDSFAVREWLAADADGRDVHDKSLGQGIACDPSGCIGKLAGGGAGRLRAHPGGLRRRLRTRRPRCGEPRRSAGGL
jgi:competence protein ComEC